MKAYIVKLIIVDHDNLGKDGIKDAIEHQNYANDCIYPEVADLEEFDIGDWEDDHPMNLVRTNKYQYLKALKKVEDEA